MGIIDFGHPGHYKYTWGARRDPSRIRSPTPETLWDPYHADHQKRIQGAQDSTYKGGYNSTTTQTINASNIVVILTTIYTY